MGNGRKFSKGNFLVVVLGGLCLVAVVLVGVVVFNATRSGGEMSEEVVAEDGDDGGQFQSEGWNDEIFNKMQDASEQGMKMVEAGASAEEFVEFYQKYIDEYVAKGESSRVSNYVWDRSDKMILAGYKQETLDALLAMDLNIVGELDKYRQYAMIVVLARELGREEVASEYNEKLADVDYGDQALAVAIERIAGLDKKRSGGNE